jgi:hypothetical protein
VENLEIASPQNMNMFQLRPGKNALYCDEAPALKADGPISLYVFDGEMVVDCLKSPDLGSVDVLQLYRELSKRTGHSFSYTEKLLSKMPVFTDGDEHKPGRIALAKMLHKTHDATVHAVGEKVSEIFSARLLAGSTIDLVSELTRPIYAAFASSIIGGSHVSADEIYQFAQILNAELSLRSRLRIEEKIVRMLPLIDEDVSVALPKLSLAILGSENLIGGIALAVWQTIERNPSLRLSEIPWPSEFPTTTFSFVDRIVHRDCLLNGYELKKGATIRVLLEAACAYGPLETKNVMFGRGKHGCVGRVLSEDLLQLVFSAFKKSELLPELKSIEFRTPDPFFCFPTKASVFFHA